MSKKLHPLAAAIRAIDALSEDEKAALRDYLRPAPEPRSKPKSERKSSQRRKVEKEATEATGSNDFCGRCGTPFDHNAHHMKQSNDYHEFVPANNAQAATGGGQ